MFLDVLQRRNPGLLEAAVTLHQRGELPANAYALDLDAIRANAAIARREADRLGLDVFAMTKQLGRAPGVMQALRAGGIDACVAVDMTDARAVVAGGQALGHVGHLVQVPGAEAAAAAELAPRNWTVFSDDKAAEAADGARRVGRTQDLLARVHAPSDRFYAGHEGGFEADDVLAVAERLGADPATRFAGITTFPALLFDATSGDVRPTPNLATLERAAGRLRDAGVEEVRVNAPGTSSSSVFGLLAEHGATQVEPGHGLTGTTPLHRERDLPEVPAACYVTEVSHLHDGRAYAFGGGLYVDPVLGDYPVRAIVAERPGLADARTVGASMPPPQAIDYYAQLDLDGGRAPRTGATVVFGFRIQAFVTRAYVAGIAGVSTDRPRVTGIWTTDGRTASWPL